MNRQRFFISLSEEVTDRVARQAIRACRPVRWHLEYLVETGSKALETKGESRDEATEEATRVGVAS